MMRLEIRLVMRLELTLEMMMEMRLELTLEMMMEKGLVMSRKKLSYNCRMQKMCILQYPLFQSLVSRCNPLNYTENLELSTLQLSFKTYICYFSLYADNHARYMFRANMVITYLQYPLVTNHMQYGTTIDCNLVC
jgi:hypothetical protein